MAATQWLESIQNLNCITYSHFREHYTGRERGLKSCTVGVSPCAVQLLGCVWLFVTPWTVAHQAPLPWNSPGKNTGGGSHCLHKGIFLTQGSNQGLPHCKQILYGLSHLWSPWATVHGVEKSRKWLRLILSLSPPYVTWDLKLTALCRCHGFYAFSHAAFSAWNTLSSFCVLENPIHFSSFNWNVSSCVKTSFILSDHIRSDYTLWSSSPMLTWLLLQVLLHRVTIVYFHIHPLASPLTYRLLQTLKDGDHDLFIFVSQHKFWQSFMSTSICR